MLVALLFFIDHFSSPYRATGRLCVPVYLRNNFSNKTTYECWFTMTLLGQTEGHRSKIGLGFKSEAS